MNNCRGLKHTRIWMVTALALSATAVCAQPAKPAPVTAPEEFFGFRIGSDTKIVRYDKIVEYFQHVAERSDRVRVRTLGPTTMGNPFVMLEISSPETLRNLDHYKALERKLYFQGGTPTDAERDQILREGKAVVLVTNNIHSNEIGASQMAIELVYRLVTEDSPAVKKVLDNCILLLVPSLNPDGQIMVTDWYNKYLGTPFEATNLPWIYHPYAGHDNNRDMFMFSQKESQMTADVLWHDWFPSIWLDEHQQGSAGPRIFTMPAMDPINSNVHPLIYRLNTIYGQTQAAALEAAGKDGIIHNVTYTNFWEGAMAWAGWWHNQVGLLTEVASARIATPVVQQRADPSNVGRSPIPVRDDGQLLQALERPSQPLPPPRDVTSRVEYPRPWLGGVWHLRDVVDYELTATFSLLEAAADRRETLLKEIYEVNRSTIESGKKGELGFGNKEKSYAVLIPASGQHDPNEVIELVDKLRIGGVEVRLATQDFEQDGVTYSAGTYVIPFDQVFARYAKDLLERQSYPEIRRAPNSPAEAPYDVSAWSLGMQFGVKTVFAKTPLPENLALAPVNATPKHVLSAETGPNSWSFPYTGAESAAVVNRLLAGGAQVRMLQATGSDAPMIRVNANPEVWEQATAALDVKITGAEPVSEARPMATPLRMPRVGLYQPWTANMDEGWTRWILERYDFPYKTLHNADVKAGGLRVQFDAIILPDQRAGEILEGQVLGPVVPEYRGGIGDQGLQALKDFVSEGGTLIAMGESTNLLIERMPLPVSDAKRSLSREQQFAPGTIVNLQVDTTHPMGFGLNPETYGFYINSPFFQMYEPLASQRATVVARYPNSNINASGWLRGEQYMLGRAAVVAVEMNPGKVVLFGIRPQHRAQTHATLPLLFNALYWSVERDSPAATQQ